MNTALEVRSLSFKYPDGKPALNDISFHVQKGESVAIIGPNGAGKTTLLLHLNGSLGLSDHNGRKSASIKVCGLELTSKNVKQIRRLIGLVFQNPDDQLFMPTVFDDVAFGPINMGLREAEVKERVTEALAMVGLEGFEQRLTYHLSFGEKKLVSIATVLSMRPELLALDEPTSGLDASGRKRIMKILSELASTKLIATHDLELAYMLTDRAILINKGTLVAQGSTRELVSDCRLMEENGLETPLSVMLQHQGRPQSPSSACRADVFAHTLHIPSD